MCVSVSIHANNNNTGTCYTGTGIYCTFWITRFCFCLDVILIGYVWFCMFSCVYMYMCECVTFCSLLMLSMSYYFFFYTYIAYSNIIISKTCSFYILIFSSFQIRSKLIVSIWVGLGGVGWKMMDLILFRFYSTIIIYSQIIFT